MARTGEWHFERERKRIYRTGTTDIDYSLKGLLLLLLGVALLWRTELDLLIYHHTFSEKINAHPFWLSPSKKLLEKKIAP